jgi:hypothetical protein
MLEKQYRSCIFEPEQQVDVELYDNINNNVNSKHPLPVMPQ